MAEQQQSEERDSAADTARLVEVTLDSGSIGRNSANVDHEREVQRQPQPAPGAGRQRDRHDGSHHERDREADRDEGDQTVGRAVDDRRPATGPIESEHPGTLLQPLAFGTDAGLMRSIASTPPSCTWTSPSGGLLTPPDSSVKLADVGVRK